MSIPGAVIELNKEIERLTKIRDSLLQGSTGVTQPAVGQPISSQKRKYVRSAESLARSSVPAKKSTVAKKSTPAKAVPAAKNREISAATRKKMSDAAKARAAAKSAVVK